MNCVICGKNSLKEYCSRQCFTTWLQTNPQSGKMTKKENYQIDNCLQCNKIFLNYLNKSRFCGNPCFKRFVKVPEQRLSLQKDEAQICYLIKKIKKKIQKGEKNG